MTSSVTIRDIPEGLPLQYQENEIPLFIAEGCALLERLAAGKFTYRAENLKSGKSVTLGRRETRLPKSKYSVIAAQMEKCAASDGWHSSPSRLSMKAHPNPGYKRLECVLNTAFEDILLQHGFTPREKQIELAREILSSMCCMDVSLAEAEVGTGKTLAYLLPSVLVRRGCVNSGKISTTLPDGSQSPVVIATSSIALQRAIERDYIPALSDILLKHGIIKKPLTNVLRKGKGHYLCERRLAHYNSFADARTKRILAPLIHGAVFDLASVKNLTPYLKRAICVDNRCGQECPKYGRCRYTRYLQEAKRGGYDFQVCNHNYLLVDIMRRTRNQRPLIPDYQAVIIDEAHKFLDAARDMYGCSLSLLELRQVISNIQDFTFCAGVPTIDIRLEAERILSKSALIFQFLNKEAPTDLSGGRSVERYPTFIRERTEKLIRALNVNIQTIAKLITDRPVVLKYEMQRKEALWTLERISESLSMFARHDDLVYWLEESNNPSGDTNENIRLPILRGIPKKLGVMLHKHLWGKKIPIILTSGTLSAAGRFEHIKKKMGLDILPEKRLLDSENFWHVKSAYKKKISVIIKKIIPRSLACNRGCIFNRVNGNNNQ
jgi:ATP-dependent DNA helicase DinG